MSDLHFRLEKDVTKRPLHIETQGAMRLPGEWFPCETPEREFNGTDLVIHDCCPRCLIAVEAAERRGTRCLDGLGQPIADLMRLRLSEWGPAPRLEMSA